MILSGYLSILQAGIALDVREIGLAFDGQSFVRQVAKRLIQEFEFSAGAGTPGLIGAAKEHPARVQLQAMMPDGILVGSGIVVDSYGGVSKQQDIVIFEKISPVFSQRHSGSDILSG